MPPLNPEPVEFLAESECAPNLPYFVTRTRNHELPIYQDRKRGGNLLITYIKNVDGGLSLLRNAIRDLLNVPEENVVMNERTRQVAKLVLEHRPDNPLAIPLYAITAQAAVDLLPDWARRMQGLRRSPTLVYGASSPTLYRRQRRIGPY